MLLKGNRNFFLALPDQVKNQREFGCLFLAKLFCTNLSHVMGMDYEREKVTIKEL